MQLKDYQLRKKEKPVDGMIRIIHGQIDLVCGLCRHIPVSAEDSVHEIRKGIKRIRSVIRLLRFGLGKERFLEENNRYGSISLLLNDLRRSAAHLETLYFILDRPQMDLPLTARQSLKKTFRKKKARLYHSLDQKNNVFSLCLKYLSVAREQLMSNPPDGITQDTILAGQVNTYQSGRRRLKRAMQDPSMENNHNLRKAAKNLWNQTQVLRVLWPPVFDPVIRSLGRLGDEMGMDHDLAELQAAIEKTSILKEKDLEIVLKAVEGQRKKSQRLAWQLAGKIYAETPAAFSKRMKVYWELLLKK